MLVKLLKILLIAGGVGLLVILGMNETAARGWIKTNPLEKVGLAQVTWQNGWWQITHLSQYWPSKADSPDQKLQLSQIWEQTWPQLNTLKDRGLATAGVAQTFVQTELISAQTPAPASNGNASASGQSGPSPTLAPLEQRALDYARYVYCQAAVKDYEQQHPEVNKSSGLN